jgi:hypothetical protein
VPDGSGTLLDHTTILHVSEFGGPARQQHRRAALQQEPPLHAGRRRPDPFKTGQALFENNRTHGDFLLTLAQGFGSTATTMGVGTSRIDGICAERGFELPSPGQSVTQNVAVRRRRAAASAAMCAPIAGYRLEWRLLSYRRHEACVLVEYALCSRGGVASARLWLRRRQPCDRYRWCRRQFWRPAPAGITGNGGEAGTTANGGSGGSAGATGGVGGATAGVGGATGWSRRRDGRPRRRRWHLRAAVFSQLWWLPACDGKRGGRLPKYRRPWRRRRFRFRGNERHGRGDRLRRRAGRPGRHRRLRPGDRHGRRGRRGRL